MGSVKEEDGLGIDIGCESRKREGLIGLDFRRIEQTDVVADARALTLSQRIVRLRLLEPYD